MALTVNHGSEEAEPGTSVQPSSVPVREDLPTAAPPVNSKPLADPQHEVSLAQDDQILPDPSPTTNTAEAGTATPLADDHSPVDIKRLVVKVEVTEVQSVAGLTPSLLSETARAGTVHSQGSDDSKDKKRLDIRWTKSGADPMPGIHWYYPVLMIFLALGGLFGALGHHLYNAHLQGKESKDSQWPSRWGVALAFFIKMMLGAAVQTAFKQRAWVRLSAILGGTPRHSCL